MSGGRVARARETGAAVMERSSSLFKAKCELETLVKNKLSELHKLGYSKLQVRWSPATQASQGALARHLVSATCSKVACGHGHEAVALGIKPAQRACVVLLPLLGLCFFSFILRFFALVFVYTAVRRHDPCEAC